MKSSKLQKGVIADSPFDPAAGDHSQLPDQSIQLYPTGW